MRRREREESRIGGLRRRTSQRGPDSDDEHIIYCSVNKFYTIIRSKYCQRIFVKRSEVSRRVSLRDSNHAIYTQPKLSLRSAT